MSKHVMIVDDDINNLDFLTTVLKKHGYESSTAKDGREGLEKLKGFKPDLLVLDVMMPKKTGFALFKQMKADADLCDIPVVMLTAIAGVIDENKEATSEETISEIGDAFHDKMEKMVQFFRSEGEIRPEAFVDKPIQPDAFVSTIEKFIGKP